MGAVLRPVHDRIYGNWSQEIVATLVARVGETPCSSVGHEFGRQVVVLFLQSSIQAVYLAKLVQVTQACITLTDMHPSPTCFPCQSHQYCSPSLCVSRCSGNRCHCSKLCGSGHHLLGSTGCCLLQHLEEV